MTLTVAIIGRPNVGKSTLFNRLAGKKLALVDNRPGVTRDWREADAHLGDLSFTVRDTAGLEEAFDDSLYGRMRRQTEAALEGADVIVMLTDGRAGMTPMDQHFADWVRRFPQPIILAVNKCEGQAGIAGIAESYVLGLGDPVPISAEHGEGLGELYEALQPFFSEAADAKETADADADDEEEEEEKALRLAIVGRPNVGKSTLVNALLGSHRVMTGPEPGVTRDAIATDWVFKGRQMRLVDTAGLRRKARVDDRIEKLAVDDTMRAIRLAQCVILVLDGTLGLDKQDLTIARWVVDEGRALILAVNKWDDVEDRARTLAAIEDRLQTSLPQIRGVPVVTISAFTGQRLTKLLDTTLLLYDVWNTRISTGPLNRWLAAMTDDHPPPVVQGRRNKLRYVTQIKARPPTFALWVSRPDALPDSYRRYLMNGLRESFGLEGVPIRLLLRKGENPYAAASG